MYLGLSAWRITTTGMTSGGLRVQNFQIMMKLINSTNIEERRNPALLIARVRCLYFLIFLGGIS